jgi:hypothetical protein
MGRAVPLWPMRRSLQARQLIGARALMLQLGESFKLAKA